LAPLKPLPYREVKRRLEAAGFAEVGQKGSHIKFAQRTDEPSRRLLGRPEERYADRRGKIAVLGCMCGDVGCWPLLVSIEPLEDRVVWRGFEQPHRSRWRHDGLGPFVFDRARYTAELERPR
jgi:predicted RNA binding protein YcfA (HicA-like mRNA interferase family)